MAETLHPAIALFELTSIAEGVRTGDAMVKRAPVDVIYAGTVHPGKYLVLVGGDVGSIDEAVAAAVDDAPQTLDHLVLADVHADVVRALRGHRATDRPGEAVGIFETATVCPAILGADRGVKSADVTLRDIHLADDLGGKAYCVFQGALAEIEAAMEMAESSVAADRVCGHVIIPQISDEMRANLDRAPRFADLLRVEP